METKETQPTFMDAVNDTIDVILDDVLAALRALLFPVFCFGIVFFADSQGVFDVVFPDASWGLLTLMGAGLYSGLMLVKLQLMGALAAPESGESK